MSIKRNELLTMGINDYLHEPQKPLWWPKEARHTAVLPCAAARPCLARGDPGAALHQAPAPSTTS